MIPYKHKSWIFMTVISLDTSMVFKKVILQGPNEQKNVPHYLKNPKP